jgi:hypothetical protein
MCVEIAFDRMSIPEARNALTELVDTAKNDDEKEHYKKLKYSSDESIKEIAKDYSAKNP